MIAIKGYQIIEKLGEGGMAAVYLAKEEGLAREVALKILTLHVTDETFKKNFLAEARLVAKLEHQHIIRIYSVGVENDQFYMEMELLRKGTLKERLEKTVLSVSDTLSIIKQIASALSYAHKRGYIHRDIKPANILFRSDDEVVLADFGIAKQEGSKGDLTRAGHSGFGTPDYMPPEQAIGDEVDGRSDLYSLGIVFYEMLTRNRPFQAATTAATIRQHMVAEIPPLPSTYAYFQPVLDKALSKEKEDRYTDVMSFLEALLLAEQNNANTNGNEQDDDKTIVYPSPQSQTANTRTQRQPPTKANTVERQATPYPAQSTSPTPLKKKKEYVRDTKVYHRPWQIPNHKASEQLIISFIDIKSSTNMTEEMGDVAYESVRNKFEAIIAENTANFNECALVKMMGDGALIIYADAIYAIERSLDIQQAVYHHSKKHKKAKFALRIGLHIGLVKLETAQKIDVHGAHVNKAARIEGCGRSGVVAMSRAVYDMVYPQLKHDVDLFWKDLGKQKLKGTHKEKVYLVSSKKIPLDWFKYKFLLGFTFIVVLATGYFIVDKESQQILIDTWNKRNIASVTKTDITDTEAAKIAVEEAKAEAKRIAAKEAEVEAKRIAVEEAEAEAKRIAVEEAEAKAKKIAAEKAEAKAESARILAEDAKAQAERKAAEETINIGQSAAIDILNSAFKRWKVLCEDYKVYRNYNDLLEINATATGGKGSRSKERMELEGQRNDAEQNIIDSFAIFTQDLKALNNLANIDRLLDDYMANRSLSSFKKKRFTKAITDEVKGNVDNSRSKKMTYYKTICK